MTEIKDVFDEVAEKPEKWVVCWYGEPIGFINAIEDHVEWAGYASEEAEDFFRGNFPAREDGMPHFIANVGPESDIFDLIGDGTQKEYIGGGLRFLSNITISRTAPFDHPVQTDRLLTDFSGHVSEDGLFTGPFAGEWPDSLEENALAEEISQYWTNRHLPRFSGAEIKLPVTLKENGTLEPAAEDSFTHILKFPNEGRKSGWALNEWMCMQLSEAAGLPTAKNALVPMGEGKPPAYLVERFDIGVETYDEKSPGHNLCEKFADALACPEAKRRYMLHDFCSLAGIDPHTMNGKTEGSMEQMAKLVKEFSTNPQADLEDFYKRAIVSWAVNDSDLHRKNVSMIFKYDTQTRNLMSGRLTPAYDITSEVHQFDDRHDIAISMAGKKRNLNKKALIRFGTNIGLEPERAEELLNQTVGKMAERAVEIANNLPADLREDKMCAYTADRIASFTVRKAKSLGLDTPEWEDTKRDKSISDEPDDRMGRFQRHGRHF